jgi:hypothetical protein
MVFALLQMLLELILKIGDPGHMFSLVLILDLDPNVSSVMKRKKSTTGNNKSQKAHL